LTIARSPSNRLGGQYLVFLILNPFPFGLLLAELTAERIATKARFGEL
jgi:hypothetical protein